MFCSGVALCCLYDRADILKIIIYIVGVVYTITGCVNLIICSQKHSDGRSGALTTVLGWIVGLGCIGLGASMLITPDSFSHLLVYVFAVLLLLGGVWHIIILTTYYRKLSMPLWLYILPLILLGAGLYILCSQTVKEHTPTIILITGIAGIVYSVETLLQFAVSKVLEKKQKKEAAASADTQAAVTPAPQQAQTPATPAKDSEDPNVIHFTD